MPRPHAAVTFPGGPDSANRWASALIGNSRFGPAVMFTDASG